MKRLFTAMTLALVLSVSTLAGEIPTGDFLPPPPQTNGTSSSQSQELTVIQPQSDQSIESELLDTFLVSIVSLLVR